MIEVSLIIWIWIKTLIVHKNLNSFGLSKLLVCEGILLDVVLVTIEMIGLQECWIKRWQAFKYQHKSQNASKHYVEMWGQQIPIIE
jgi:hypothetical protein